MLERRGIDFGLGKTGQAGELLVVQRRFSAPRT
jgi:hypothetical protein